MSVRTPKLLERQSCRPRETGCAHLETLARLLSEDLDFHDQDSLYAAHGFHSFPAKFPPQLPRKFIEALTAPGDVVLDPMAGSGTTVLEAYLAGRRGIGFDIDPLALLLTRAKTMPCDPVRLARAAKEVLDGARRALAQERGALEERLAQRWDARTSAFVDYWFARETQLELQALMEQLERVDDVRTRAFLNLAFSAIIITKSGGVSLAFDLAHTRPHRARVVMDTDGRTLYGGELAGNLARRVRFVTKTLRSALAEFENRVKQNIGALAPGQESGLQPCLTGLMEDEYEPLDALVVHGSAEALPLADASVDLIVTSPPYASNAIDYMRAHKFSLVWMGYPIDALGKQRKLYIGGEALTDADLEVLPQNTRQIVAEVTRLDPRKGRVLCRYYSEMSRVLREMHRVLRSGKSAIVVVGSSVMRGRDTETQNCLAEIGAEIGFQVPAIGVRSLDRDRRMMPASSQRDAASQIQQRMHVEYVIGFLKPEW
ncbi:MAG: site-specific DNA-methyltransferase [Chloroflexi bacterium]|nr:site-specific DNA-methyltransferase [Chloroflexota bacterium]